MHPRELERKRKILFIAGTTSEAEMFGPIRKQLPGGDILAISVNKNSKKRAEIEKVFQSLNFPCKTMWAPSQGKAYQIIKETQPDIVVVGHDITPGPRLFVECASSLNIPTLLVQDGLWDGKEKECRVGNFWSFIRYWRSIPPAFFWFIKNKDYSWGQRFEILWFELRHGEKGRKLPIYGHGKCTKIAVFSDTVKDLRVSEGIKPERIMVTGNPKFDQIFNCKKVDCKQRVCQRYGIPLTSEIITLLTQPYVGKEGWSINQRERFISVIAEAAMTLPNIELVIKVHPVEAEADYLEIGKKLSRLPLISKSLILPELIVASSVIITVASTAALEAMAAEKPVIIVNLFGAPEPLFYKESGAIYVDREEDILPAIRKALYDPHIREQMREPMERFVYEQAHLQDGQASKRIADLILSMTSSENPLKV